MEEVVQPSGNVFNSQTKTLHKMQTFFVFILSFNTTQNTFSIKKCLSFIKHLKQIPLLMIYLFLMHRVIKVHLHGIFSAKNHREILVFLLADTIIMLPSCGHPMQLQKNAIFFNHVILVIIPMEITSILYC